MVWDIDNTLLAGVYLESGTEPPAGRPGDGSAVLAELAARGILHAIASRNPPGRRATTPRRSPAGTFAAAECGWDRKSAAVQPDRRRTWASAPDAIAFVDDDPYERAEVGFALPEVLVLSPEDMADALGWPEFSPPVVTAGGQRRGEMYAERRRRQQAERAFGGTREEFLRYCRHRDERSPRGRTGRRRRLAELSVRTQQFNSAAGGTRPRRCAR